MRRARVVPFALGISFVLVAMPPPTAATGGMAILAVIAPQGDQPYTSFDIEIAVYQWDKLVDPDTIEAISHFTCEEGYTCGYQHLLTRVGIGKYQSTLEVYTEYPLYEITVQLSVRAQLGALVADGAASFSGGTDDGKLGGGAGVFFRIANLDELGGFPQPGDTVQLELRTYALGRLANATNPLDVYIYPCCGEPMSGTLRLEKVSKGVYAASFTIPSDLSYSQEFEVHANICTATDGSVAVGCGQGKLRFWVHPIPALLWIEDLTGTSAVIHVLAVKDSSPISGAKVSVWADAGRDGWGYQEQVPLTARTDADGRANVTVEFPAGWRAGFGANVELDGRSTFVTLYNRAPELISGHRVGMAAVADLLTNGSELQRGEAPVIRVHLTAGGVPLSDHRVTRILYPAGRMAEADAANVTTDLNGNLTLVLPNSSGGKMEGRVAIAFIAAEGVASLEINFQGGSPEFSKLLRVRADYEAETRNVGISADYLGSENLMGASAVASLYPGWSPSDYLSHAGGLPLGVLLNRTGSSFAGDLQLPASWPEGNFTVVVRLANGGATELASDVLDVTNTTMVDPSARPVGPPPLPGPPVVVLPGFGPLAAAVAFSFWATARSHRPRRGRA